MEKLERCEDEGVQKEVRSVRDCEDGEALVQVSQKHFDEDEKSLFGMKRLESKRITGGEEEDEEDASFFEGAEKLLEIWFKDKAGSDLRVIPRHEWDSVLSYVHCLIISHMSSADHDAYVLSESSMFISRQRFILKTCGKTTLLLALHPLLSLVFSYCQNTPQSLFYSRKSYLQPDHQPQPHGSFSQEADFLLSLFPDGRSYCMGDMNRDCWYLFKVVRLGTFGSPFLVPSCPGLTVEPDQTLEVLMSNLEPEAMQPFFQSDGITAQDVTKKTGIASLLPGSSIDAVLFSPCGYSLNGLTSQGYYWTIHVTPEANFSYASFETNLELCPGEVENSFADDAEKKVTLLGLLTQLLHIFRPKKLITTLFANSTSKCHMVPPGFASPPGYYVTGRQWAQFSLYSLLFLSMERGN
uniref:adenosylmethionine decarboxylase n=1 Tax=Eptatretus burgeri TaxID=7764 RepID=A0A8C4QAL1_EPTBU